MSCEDDKCKDTEEIPSNDLPIFDKPNLPKVAQVILLAQEKDYKNGGEMVLAYRLPLNRIVPGNAPQSVLYSLSDPDAGITIPDEEIVPAYVESFGNFDLKKAIASSDVTRARFLIVALDPNISGNYIIQSSGFFSFPEVHNYNVGQTYYLSNTIPGGVTNSAPPGNPQPLFFVVDKKTILIKIGD